jgi:hypothetical protein
MNKLTAVLTKVSRQLAPGAAKACLIAAICACAVPVNASIIVGPYIFDDLAFADDATQIDAGTITLFGGAVSLDDALTGHSPTKGIVNIGIAGNANLFQLDFTDLMAVNGAGADIVLFDARFSADPYSIAVRTAGGGLSAFLPHGVAAQVATGVAGPGGSFLFGIEIDISAYGLAPGTIVDAIQFSALTNANGNVEGDPAMAAVLNGASAPEPGALLLVGLGLAGLALSRRRKSGQ